MCVFTVSEYRFGFDLGRFKMIDLIQGVDDNNDDNEEEDGADQNEER